MTSELDAETIVKAWLAQPPWMLADLRRRLRLRAAFRVVRQQIWEGKYE